MRQSGYSRDYVAAQPLRLLFSRFSSTGPASLHEQASWARMGNRKHAKLKVSPGTGCTLGREGLDFTIRYVMLKS
jgi:hypothetical protein